VIWSALQNIFPCFPRARGGNKNINVKNLGAAAAADGKYNNTLNYVYTHLFLQVISL